LSKKNIFYIKMTQILNLNIVSLAWGTLVASVGFGWDSYNDKEQFDDMTVNFDNLLVAVILETLALISLTLLVTMYTMSLKEMNYISLNLFFLNFILLSVSIAFLWNICPEKDDGNLDTNNHIFYSAILISISLFLLLVHYLYELEPYITAHNKKMKLKK
jgi:hypothetical protein